MTERIGQKFGNYRLTRLLGEGGFASVYLAEHIHLHTEAAIKVLTARLSDREIELFRHEASILARFNHPNIIHMLDFGLEEKEHRPFLVMQYAAHGTLHQRHPEGCRVPLSLVRLYVKSIAAALQYAHDRQVIHRDVKPDNMLIGDQEEILLSDFGIALLSQSTLNSLHKPMQGMEGTPYYMAPEQIRGKPQPASDQYALAIVTYEWLCGVRPFQGTFAEVCAQQIANEPPPLCQKLPALSLEVEQVVMKALAKDPKQRFESIQAFAMAFEKAVEKGVSGIESVAAVAPFEHMAVSSEHVEEQKVAVTSCRSGSPRFDGLQSSLLLHNDLAAVTRLASPKTDPATTQLASDQSGSPRFDGLQSSLLLHNDLAAVTQLASPKAGLAATVVTSRRQVRKRRLLLIGVVALALLSALVGSTIFAILIPLQNTHNATNATVHSVKATVHPKTTAHSPVANATATSTKTAQLPTATPTASPITTAQPPTAPVNVHVVSSADFTTQPPGLNNMTLVTNESFYSNGHSVLSNSLEVAVAFTLQPDVKTVTLSVTGLVSRSLLNTTGFSPINIYCNNQIVASNYTMPGNGGTGTGPSTATFSISMQQLTQGNNQLQLVVASDAATNFWLYNLTVTQSS
jgi:serine/threonine protein kinase